MIRTFKEFIVKQNRKLGEHNCIRRTTKAQIGAICGHRRKALSTGRENGDSRNTQLVAEVLRG